MTTNQDRSNIVLQTLSAFSELSEGRDGLYDDEQSVLEDLLCNLMHYCSNADLDIDKALRVARFNFEAEAEVCI